MNRRFLNSTILLMLLILSSSLQAQFKSVGFGAWGGIGEIKSNSPSLTSFSGTIFIETEPEFTKDVVFRVSFIYARKIEYFLPENRTNRYFPFLKGFSLRANIRQELNKYFYLEEGAGLLFINDRIFNDIDVWDMGFVVNILIGLNLKSASLDGFELGLGGEYGGTVIKTKAGYYMFYFQCKYVFNF